MGKKLNLSYNKNLEGESDSAFNLFMIYRNLGSDRTVTRAAFLSKRAVRSLYQYSAMWSWKERAKAYDESEQSTKIKDVQKTYQALISLRYELNIAIKAQIMSLNKSIVNDIDKDQNCVLRPEFQKTLKKIEHTAIVLNNLYDLSEIHKEDMDFIDRESDSIHSVFRERLNNDSSLAMKARDLIGCMFADDEDYDEDDDDYDEDDDDEEDNENEDEDEHFKEKNKMNEEVMRYSK
ncbi:MAG: hypothetical protein NT007_16475 [Candidatus Kapabacteria bacterium]|nr:hypothetical protein [Candidatus Kapabacteria bacterium]